MKLNAILRAIGVVYVTGWPLQLQRVFGVVPVVLMRLRPLIAAVVVAIAASGAAPAWAGSSKSDEAREQMLREMERERVQARQERERAREEARQERERAKAEAERAREQAKAERERAKAEALRAQQEAAQARAAALAAAQETAQRSSVKVQAASSSELSTSPGNATTTSASGKNAAANAPTGKSTAPAAAAKKTTKVDDDDDDADEPRAANAAGSGAASGATITTASTAGSASAAGSRKGDDQAKSRAAEKAKIFEPPPETVIDALKLLFGSSTQPVTKPDPAPIVSKRYTPAAVTPAEAEKNERSERAGKTVKSDTASAPLDPSKIKAQAEAASKVAQAAAASKATPPAKAATHAPKPVPAPIHPPRPGEFRPNEVLAVNLSQAAIERARQSGLIVVATVSVPGSNIAVTRIILPPGVPRHTVRDMLDPNMSEMAFAMNRVYRIYYPSNSLEAKTDTAAGASLPAAAPRLQTPGSVATPAVPADSSATSCSPSRCYGAQLVGWQPQLASCARDVRVGVIDTGVDRSHPALRTTRLVERTFTPDGYTMLNDGHGTGVVTLLGGHPRSGTPGLVPEAQFYVANVFGADEKGRPVSDTFSLLKAIDWLHQSGVKVANVSLSGPHDPLLQKAIEDYSAKGMVFVAAAGNEGPTARPSYPAAYPQVIAVTAVDKDLKSYRHANRGSYIDVAAPGVGVWTAMPGAKEGPMTGTSFAVPYITAMVAAVHNAAPRKSKAEVLGLLPTRDLGPEGVDPIYGRGLALAPASCRPGELLAVARGPNPWSATVMRASAAPGR